MRHFLRTGRQTKRHTCCGRPGPDGVLTFALPVAGDVPLPWLNPYTAIGPAGAVACACCPAPTLTLTSTQPLVLTSGPTP